MGSLRGFGQTTTGPGDLGVRDRREAVHPFRGLVLGGHLRRSGFFVFLFDKKKWTKGKERCGMFFFLLLLIYEYVWYIFFVLYVYDYIHLWIFGEVCFLFLLYKLSLILWVFWDSIYGIYVYIKRYLQVSLHHISYLYHIIHLYHIWNHLLACVRSTSCFHPALSTKLDPGIALFVSAPSLAEVGQPLRFNGTKHVWGNAPRCFFSR